MSSRGSMVGKVATMPIVDNWRALVERLQTEADLCRNEGAEDIAALLDEAVKGLQGAASERERLAPLMQAVEWLLNEGYMDQENLARLRAAWEAA